MLFKRFFEGDIVEVKNHRNSARFVATVVEHKGELVTHSGVWGFDSRGEFGMFNSSDELTHQDFVCHFRDKNNPLYTSYIKSLEQNKIRAS